MIPDPDVIGEIAAYHTERRKDAVLLEPKDRQSPYTQKVSKTMMESAKKLFLDRHWVWFGPKESYCMEFETEVPENLRIAFNHIAASVSKQLGIPVNKVGVPVETQGNRAYIPEKYYNEILLQLRQEKEQGGLDR